MAPPPFVSKSLLHFSSFRHKKFIITKKRETFYYMMEDDKDDQYLTDVLSYSAERLAKVNRE